MTTLVDENDPALADLFSRSQRVLVLTGAGVSAPSGLPTYRGAGGLYNDTEIEALHHAEALPASLDALWGFYGQLRQQVASVEPNSAHKAIAAWQLATLGQGRRFTLATQNIDDLHERASSPQVAHLHGSLYSTCCMDEACAYGARHDPVAHLSAPPCPVCGGRLRPAIVLFGERLFGAAEREARLAVRDCDLFVAIGTSAVVSTALGLLRYATDVGATAVCIDPAPEVDERFGLHLQDRAELVLPRLIAT
jgi:NAD-dependent deacetylase